MRNKNLICPCCGLYYFAIEDGYEYCQVCGWQDDPVQRDDPDYGGGANKSSLNERKKFWQENHTRTAIEGYLDVVLDQEITFTYDDLPKLKKLSTYAAYQVSEILEAFGEKWFLMNDDEEDGELIAYDPHYFIMIEPGPKERLLLDDVKIANEESDPVIANPEIIQMQNNGLFIHKAIEFATYAHRNQTRKGGDKPYISHPFEVAMLLQKENCDIKVIIAGLLHDTVEDAGVTLDEIKAQFGERVSELVASCSEDKSKTWHERKEHTIKEMMECTDYDVLVLSCADKTANLRSMMADYLEVGEKLWDRFNAKRENILHYYSKMNDAFEPMLNCTKLYWENTRLYQDLFVKYYLNKDGKIMYQTNGEEAYIYDNTEWSEISVEEIEKLIEENKIDRISNEDAYNFEHISWYEEIDNYYEYMEHGKKKYCWSEDEIKFV